MSRLSRTSDDAAAYMPSHAWAAQPESCGPRAMASQRMPSEA